MADLCCRVRPDRHRHRFCPDERGAGVRPGDPHDDRDRQGHPRGRPGLPDPPIQGHRDNRPASGRPGGRHREQGHPDPPRRQQAHRALVRPIGPAPGPGLPGRSVAVGLGRLHRHEHRGARQRPDRGRGSGRVDGGGIEGGLPHRGGHRHVRGGPRPSRRDCDRDAVPEHRHRHLDRVRLRWVPPGAVHARRWRYFHQSG